MNSDHLESWRNYLVGQMQERRGIAKPEAQQAVDRWLSSPEETAGPDIEQGSHEENVEG
jgi:hypothetical protein